MDIKTKFLCCIRGRQASRLLGMKKSNPEKSFKELVDLVKTLRSDRGCPWDKSQTQKSLVQYAVEEAFELAEAIESENQNSIKEELGDFLFQVILQAQVAEDEGKFNLEEVITMLNQKMIRRHPHVFASEGSKSIEQIWEKWEEIKNQEKQSDQIFSYPKNLPALIAANKIGVKTTRYAFDWQSATEVRSKVSEELSELEEAIATKNMDEIENELGDLLFVIAQWARHLNIDPEQALRKCNRRFQKRFSTMMTLSQMEKPDFARLSPTEKEALWEKAKKYLKSKEL